MVYASSFKFALEIQVHDWSNYISLIQKIIKPDLDLTTSKFNKFQKCKICKYKKIKKWNVEKHLIFKDIIIPGGQKVRKNFKNY